jgi:hypothetical protein
VIVVRTLMADFILLLSGDDENPDKENEDLPNPEMPPPANVPRRRCSTCSDLAPNRKAMLNLKKVSTLYLL